jgi:hypothetical protein
MLEDHNERVHVGYANAVRTSSQSTLACKPVGLGLARVAPRLPVQVDHASAGEDACGGRRLTVPLGMYLSG